MVSRNKYRNILVTGGLLAISALLGTGLMVLVNRHSVPYIEHNERQVILRSLNAVIPVETYDNDILNDSIQVTDKELLGSSAPSTVYRARAAGRPVAAALTIIAPNGYSGPIVLLVGIDYTGQITGVRVVRHRETPGLGDSIEIQRSSWIESFDGKSSTNPSAAGWKVKRDGGEFDQFTGATITPRAVVSAVHKSLNYFQKHREFIFSIPEPAEINDKPVKMPANNRT
ncbi:electron transport complex subunit RsxG [Sulfuriflexus sp.]|uniref:electron transport complex subunit RsxG n=1 Tax=Sulfuriflexus sp. TaxID=2015443 RepID=UPI0028CEB799|nr:electron transport complex subunit RsxG [Sulfuriflexus sp.]MDT8404510.1 electron transport complex subunit RsxG [Sulfuriflexus sp.]